MLLSRCALRFLVDVLQCRGDIDQNLESGLGVIDLVVVNHIVESTVLWTRIHQGEGILLDCNQGAELLALFGHGTLSLSMLDERVSCRLFDANLLKSKFAADKIPSSTWTNVHK